MIFGLSGSEYGLLGQRVQEAMEPFAPQGGNADAGEIEQSLKRALAELRASGVALPPATPLSFVYPDAAFNILIWHTPRHHASQRRDGDLLLGSVLYDYRDFVDLWVHEGTKELAAEASTAEARAA